MVGPAVLIASGADVKFAKGNSALNIPFRLFNNHIYLQVSVNGSAPLWFVLDTGGGGKLALIATKRAKVLGLKLTPAGQARGNGISTQDVFLTSEVSFTLPGVTVIGERFAALDMETLEGCSNELDVDLLGDMRKRKQARSGTERQPFDGVIGMPFFKQFVVELDPVTRMMNLYDPKSYKYTGTGEAIPLDERWPYIFINTTLESPKGGAVKGRFMIDTGLMTSVSLLKPFIESNALMPSDDHSSDFSICGIGGYSKARLAHLSSIRVGSREIRDPVTTFSQAASGQMTDADYDGIIGNAILLQFKVIFDIYRSRMYLQPIAK